MPVNTTNGLNARKNKLKRFCVLHGKQLHSCIPIEMYAVLILISASSLEGASDSLGGFNFLIPTTLCQAEAHVIH